MYPVRKVHVSDIYDYGLSKPNRIADVILSPANFVRSTADYPIGQREFAPLASIQRSILASSSAMVISMMRRKLA